MRIGFLPAIRNMQVYEEFYLELYSLNREDYRYNEVLFDFDPKIDYEVESYSTEKISYKIIENDYYSRTEITLPDKEKENLYCGEEVYDFLHDIIPERENTNLEN